MAAFNIESFLRISADVTGIKDVTKLEKALKGTEKAAKSAASGMKAMIKSKAFQGLAVAATAVGGAFGLSAKAAIDFEDKMSQVLKVMDDMSKKQVKALKAEIIGLGQVLPISIQGIADIYEAAGSAGKARDEMKEFALDVGRVSTAFDLTAAEAGSAMGKMQGALDLTNDELRDLFDAINYVSEGISGSAADITDFMNRAAGAGKAAGLAAEETAALGAAMINSGTNSSIAATSLRSLVSALTKGESMTNKQTAALARLGYAQADAKGHEERLTSEVERQSDKRIEIARNETDQLGKEINRRYRDQLTALRDNMDDESEEFEEGVTDKAEKEIKGLQRRMDREMEMARQRAEREGRSATAETQQIRDKYDEQIDAVRDNMRDELKVRRRADRDRLTRLQDRMDDEKEVELKANEKKFKEFEEQEKVFRAQQLEEAKVTAQEMGRTMGESMGTQMAQSMQDNALGTITEVFNRVRSLSKAEQLSVFTDLAGEQSSRGFINLINNAKEYDEVIGRISDKTKFAGSVMREFAKRNDTTASNMIKMRNAMEGNAILIGGEMLPVINQFIKALKPLIQAFSWMLTNIPGFAPILVILAGAFVGLAVALPIISSLVFLVSQLGVTLSVGSIQASLGIITAKFKLLWATISGFKVGAIFAGFGSKMIAGIGVSLKVIGASFATVFGSVPVLIGLAIAASIALIWTFRDQIKDAFIGIGRSISEVFIRVADFIKQPLQAVMSWVKSAWDNTIGALRTSIKNAFGWVQKLIAAAQRALRLGRKSRSQKSAAPQAMAQGGVLDGPELVLAGEAGREYIIPERKMTQASKNWLSGRRGGAVIPAMAQGGVVGSTGATGGAPNIHISTGPVLQQQGVDYVTVSDLEGALQTFSKAIFANSRTTGARRYQGVY